jgi:hypothetical protein
MGRYESIYYMLSYGDFRKRERSLDKAKKIRNLSQRTTKHFFISDAVKPDCDV